MVTLIKLAGVWAVVSAGLVSALMPSGPAMGGRAALEQASPVAALLETSAAPVIRAPEPARTDCAAQTWPYLSRECIAGAEARQPVRTITAGGAAR